MSKKQEEDKKKEGFPWTARQKRRLQGGRKARKVERHNALRRPGKKVAKK